MDQDKKNPETPDQEETVTGEPGGSIPGGSIPGAGEPEEGSVDAVAEADEPVLSDAERRLAETSDRLLRMQAELENTRKRTRKEIERVRKYALESFALELLEVKDNLERSLGEPKAPGAVTGTDTGTDADDKAAMLENIHEGVSLTLKSLQRVFADFGIQEVEAMGRTFDPLLHQAVSTLETPDRPPNTVIELIQKGYLLNDRLLRAAVVVVATGPGESARQSGEEGAVSAESEKPADTPDTGEDTFEGRDKGQKA